MDYLRTIGSAAVSSVLSKSGLNLPFSLGPKVPFPGGICNLYDATKRDDSMPVSVFEYDLSDPSRRSYIPLAKNALKKLRTMRHPDVLKFVDAVETESTIYIVTERVKPLRAALQSVGSKAKQEREDYLIWGLHRIAVALAFLNDSGSSTHGSLRVESIFISPSGEWKLGGFEVLSNPNDEAPVLYTFGGLLPDSSSWAAPEVKKSGWSALKASSTSAADAYALGLLLHSVFNPTHPLPATAEPPHPPPTANSRGDIPPSIFPHFKKLLNPNHKTRQSPQDFLNLGMLEPAGFFANNRLLQVCNGLDNFVLASEGEKNSLLRTLKDSSGSFPIEFVSFRILPALATALERGGASAAAILPLVLQFGADVDPAEYANVILSPLIKLYSSPDRGTRMALLDHLPEYVDKLDKKAISDKIFPHLQTGFTDTVAVIREATVKAISLIAPKLSERLLNNDLLRHLAKMQQDSEASIRTNTCILIGRLGPTLGYNTKKKVLVPAFTKAAKDPFVHCRVAGLMAFMASIECFEVEDLATKVIPSISFAMIDKEKLVRDQAFKTVELFVKRLESHASTMSETSHKPETAVGSQDAMTAQGGVLVNSAAGAAGALAGWAMSSLTKKLAHEEMQSSIPSVNVRPGSTPPVVDTRLGSLRPDSLSVPGGFPSVSAGNSTATTPTIPTSSMGRSQSKAKGMQLGANKVPSSMTAAATVLAEDFGGEDGLDDNPWGEDLMDVNADDDDWSAFEAAPEPHAPASHTNLGTNPTKKHLTAPKLAVSRSISSPQPNADNDWDSGKLLHAGLGAKKPIHSSQLTTSHSFSPPKPKPKANTDWDSGANWDDGGSDNSKDPPSRAATPSAPMTKEEKAEEMHRRKEERKQRIAALKEQKKTALGKS